MDDRNDPFRRQLMQLRSDGCQEAIADVKAHRSHFVDEQSLDAWTAKHAVWRQGYEWGWKRQLELEGAS